MALVIYLSRRDAAPRRLVPCASTGSHPYPAAVRDPIIKTQILFRRGPAVPVGIGKFAANTSVDARFYIDL